MCFGKVGKKNHNLTGSRGWEGDKGDGQNFELPGSRGREAGHHRPGTARHPEKGSLLRRQGAQPQNLPFLSKFFRDSKNQLPPHQPLRQNRKEEMGDGDLLSFEGGWVQRVHSSPPPTPPPPISIIHSGWRPPCLPLLLQAECLLFCQGQRQRVALLAFVGGRIPPHPHPPTKLKQSPDLSALLPPALSWTHSLSPILEVLTLGPSRWGAWFGGANVQSSGELGRESRQWMRLNCARVLAGGLGRGGMSPV